MSEHLIAIDPSLKGCGVAWFARGRLWGVQLLEARTLEDAAAWASLNVPEGAEVVCEFPEYRGRGSRVNPNDLVLVGAVAGMLVREVALRGGPVRLTRPSEWKRNAPKDVTEGRVWNAATPEETTVLRSASARYGRLFHNVVDAVAIGFWALGRLP